MQDGKRLIATHARNAGVKILEELLPLLVLPLLVQSEVEKFDDVAVWAFQITALIDDWLVFGSRCCLPCLFQLGLEVLDPSLQLCVLCPQSRHDAFELPTAVVLRDLRSSHESLASLALKADRVAS